MTLTAASMPTAKEGPFKKEPVRILHVYSGNLYGGIETFLRTLAQHAGDADVTTEFALCFEGRLAEELRTAGASLHILGAARARSPRSIAAVRRGLGETLRKGRHE